MNSKTGNTYFQRYYTVNGVKTLSEKSGVNSSNFNTLEIMDIAFPILSANPLTIMNITVKDGEGDTHTWTYGGYKWNVMSAKEQTDFINNFGNGENKDSEGLQKEYSDVNISYKPISHNIRNLINSSKRLRVGGRGSDTHIIEEYNDEHIHIPKNPSTIGFTCFFMCLQAFIFDKVYEGLLPKGTYSKVMKLFLDYTKYNGKEEQFNYFRNISDYDNYLYQ